VCIGMAKRFREISPRKMRVENDHRHEIVLVRHNLYSSQVTTSHRTSGIPSNHYNNVPNSPKFIEVIQDKVCFVQRELVTSGRHRHSLGIHDGFPGSKAHCSTPPNHHSEQQHSARNRRGGSVLQWKSPTPIYWKG
jgi:hypothetical protein